MQKIVRIPNFFPTTKLLKKKKKERKETSSSVLGEATLAVTAGGGRGCALHVLVENGLESLISVYHGAEHQGLEGGDTVAEPTWPGWRRTRPPTPR